MNFFKKLQKFSFFFLVLSIVFFQLTSPIQTHAQAPNEKKKIGDECADKNECFSASCDAAQNGKKYCTCGGTGILRPGLIGELACKERYGALPNGQNWECKDGADATSGLPYCTNGSDRVESVLPLLGAGLGDYIFDPELGAQDIKNVIGKPQTQISIPGVKFSDPQVTEDVDGNVYLSIPFLSEYIFALFRYVILFLGVISVLMIIFAGFRWVTSGGNADSIGSAKKMIANAIIGLLIGVGSYTILFTINPKLVGLQNLKVEFVRRENIGNLIDSSNVDVDPPSSAMYAGTISGNCDSYDELFKKYAPCMGTDWRVLKAIASVESGCNPQAKNSAGFVGMGQTKPQYCKSIFNVNGFKKWENYCTEEYLQTPQVGIAVIALLQKDAARQIKKYCANATPQQQGAMFHAYNNVPAAAARMIHGGCTNQEDFIGYFNSTMKKKQGYLNTTLYLNKYGNILQSQGEEAYLRAIGNAKLQYALSKAGPAFALLGGNVKNATPAGTCPLETETPF